MAAWEYGPYRYGMDGTPDPRLAAAILAVKQELIYVEVASDVLKPDLPKFGDATRNSVKRFQESQGLPVDGMVGAATSRELFRKRIENIEDRHGLERGLLGKKSSLESSFDPVAIGSKDPRDRGFNQINLYEIVFEGEHGIHHVSLEDAYDPAFSLSWAARYLVGLRDQIITEIEVDKAMVAAYNSGGEFAKRWLLDDFPTSGGPKMPGTDEDSYVRMTRYWSLVQGQNF